MKRLLLTPITRDAQSVGDWIPASAQNTMEGCADFWQRQKDRMAAAGKAREQEARAVVRPLRRQP